MNKSRGVTLVEIVVGVSIFGVLVVSVVGIYAYYAQTIRSNTHELSATFLLEEGAEIMRYMRDNNWAASLGNATLSTTYYLSSGGGDWELTTTEQQFTNFLYERTVVLSAVYRDGNDDIAVSGTLDTDTKKVDITVAWDAGTGTTSKMLSLYLTNLFE